MPDNVQISHPSGSVTGFGRAVGDARRAKQLTQQETADLLGMSRRTLIDIEADRVTPRRFEKAGILAMLSPERAEATPAATRRTWRRVLLGSPNRPRVWLDIEEEGGLWWAAMGFDNGRVGGLDTFKGPFGAREAAERNAAAFGCDFMQARGCHVQRTIVRRIFGFRDKGANPAPVRISPGKYHCQRKTTDKGWNVFHEEDCIAEFYGPQVDVAAAIAALNKGDQIDKGFEQRHGVEVFLANGRSPSET